MPTASREIQLAARPQGEPKPTDFRLTDVEVADPGDGEVLIRNTWMSVDPYMRGRMNDVKSYVPPFALDAPLDGGAVGEVVSSNAEGFAPGDVVLHGLGWREHAVLPAKAVAKIAPVEGIGDSAHLGVLGMPGLTAYAGLIDVASLTEGDVVFVTGAAGAVGSLVGQIAKLRGHRVIGSAGTAEKVRHLTEDLGFDAAFDYHDGPTADRLAELAPDGIDVMFDNVGGEQLEAGIGAANLNGRFALCGAISVYNATERPAGPSNLFLLVGKRLNLRGFIVRDHGDLRQAMLDEVGPAVADGRIQFRETVVDGLGRAPEAFVGLLRGENTGKMVVKLG